MKKSSHSSPKKVNKGFLESTFQPNEKKIVFSLFIISFIIRLLYIFEIQGEPFVEHLFSDPLIYDNWGWQLADKGGWIGSDVFFMAPLYPYFLGFIYLVFGHSILIVQLVQVLVSSLSVVFIYLIGRNFHSKEVGIISAVIAVFYSTFIFYTAAILSETLQVFVLTVLIYAISNYSDKNDKFDWLGVGLLVGIAALLRANILLFILFVLIWFLLKIRSNRKFKNYALRSMFLFLIGTAIPILPITIRNFIVADDFVLLTSNGGINFYIGNNERSPGVFITPVEFNYYDDMAGQKFAQQKLGYKISASEASSFWYGEGLSFLTSNPGKGIGLLLKKSFLFFGEGENAQSAIMDQDYFTQNYSNILKLPLFGFYFISLFGIFGLVLAFKKKRNEQQLLYSLFLAYFLGTILFFVNGRFRLGITPLFIVFASYGIYMIVEKLKEGNFKEFVIPSTTVLVFILSFNFIIEKPEFNDYDAYMQLGEIAFQEEDYDKAVDYYNKSLFFKDYYLTYMNIGNALALKKDYRNAVAAFTKSIARNPSDPMVHFNLGYAYTQQNMFEQAIDSFNKAIDIDPTFAGAYRNAGIIFYIQEDWENALFYFDKFLEISDDEEIKYSVRADVEQIKLKMKEPKTEKNQSN